MVPTESAHLLHTRGKEIADKMNRLKEEMIQFQKRDEILRIGCANGVLKAIFLNLILDFIRKYPGIHVEWSEYENSQVLSKLMVSELEYGFVVGEAEDSSICQRLVYRRLRSIVRCFCWIPPYASGWCTAGGRYYSSIGATHIMREMISHWICSGRRHF